MTPVAAVGEPRLHPLVKLAYKVRMMAMAVVALANETNRLANGDRIDVDERFRSPLA